MTEQRVVIAGIGHTPFGTLSGRSLVSLSVEASRKAVEDSGIDRSMIDAVFTKSITSGHQRFFGQKLAEALRLQPAIGGTWDQGGASNVTMVSFAANAIQAGQCDIALVVAADNPRSGTRSAYARPLTSFDAPYGWFGVTAGYAMIAQRHMAQYGTTSEQLGAIAVACRDYGADNPHAQLRKRITLEDHRRSPRIVDPLRKDDCCLVSDGAAAVIVMSEERARQLGVEEAVPILGIGHGQTSWDVALRTDLTRTCAEVSGARAFAAAGLTPASIDVAQIYDCFTITVLMTLEDYGFCAKGEGGYFVADGGLGIDGHLPTNTSGGLLSESGLPGMQLIIEGVRQIRGRSVNQVRGARHALVSGQGGTMHTHATMILGG